MKFNKEAREGLILGANKLVDAIKVTLGAKGRHVAYQDALYRVYLTKDGATVGKHVIPTNPIENMGANIVREASEKTAKEAGDGTSTSSVLAQAIINEGFKYLEAGHNPILLKKGMEMALEDVRKYLADSTVLINDNTELLKQVASVSANGDRELGELIVDTLLTVGEYGVVKIEESNTSETYADITQGLEFDRGLMSPYFVTNPERQDTEMDDPLILLYDGKLSNFQALSPLMEKINSASRNVLVIAEDIDMDCLQNIVANRVRSTLKIATVKAPSFADNKTEILEDIAILTDTKVYNSLSFSQLCEAELEDLGNCERIISGRNNTVIIGGVGQGVDERIETIKARLDNPEDEDNYDSLKERLAKLTGGVAVIYVGGNSKVEQGEKKDRVEDAVLASKAALDEGVVVGGGTALVRALEYVKSSEDEVLNAGINIIRKALEKPLFYIAENGGAKGDIVVEKVKESTGNTGYNVFTDTYEDLFKQGVVDPKKVTRVALENAVSVAGMLLTTECAIPYKPFKIEEF